MFSSALKSFSSNITSNYSLSPQPVTICGPWKIYDGKKRSGGKLVSVFVFDKKSLEPQAGLGRSSGGLGLKQAQDEVVERLKKEAASLARLRHPSILQLEEPVEETQSGGLRFATEPVTDSLAGLLQDQRDADSTGAGNARGGRGGTDESSGNARRHNVDIDELEIQKGLLQVAKGLEFLHESAQLVHANLTPDAVFVNAKSDWKISGLGFSTPPANASNASMAPIVLSEVLNFDTRLPRHVQLNLDYSSPDLVMDNNITTAADMFSLGLVIIAMYNNPHRSPLDTSMSVSTYKRLLSSPASTPTQRNNFLSTKPVPEQVASSLLPRLITRRPAQRYGAREFQEAQYFDSILVSTLRFLDSLPAKTVNEKSQFMRGFPRIMPQFPKSVLEKKVLPALLEEMKDVDLLPPILEVIFKIIETVPNGKAVFSEKVIPRLRQVFLPPLGKGGKAQERDASKEAGLLVIMERMPLVAKSCTGKEFKDDILPLVFLGLDAHTHAIQDVALSQLSTILPVLDFSTIKNDLFPLVAHVFSKTSSMAIKIRGLEAFNVLCGGTTVASSNANDLMGTQKKTNSSSAVLDKYTIQEKVVPLLKAIKTKEPAVSMAALEVFKQVAKVADAPFLAFDVLPVLWQFSLGPLLNLAQFQEFMTLIKSISSRIEDEQTRKLQQLGGRGGASSSYQNRPTNGAGPEDGDFETLVTGRSSKTNGVSDDSWESAWTDDNTQATATMPSQRQSGHAPTFSWSGTAPPTGPATNSRDVIASRSQISRTVTPDTMTSFASLAPSRPGQQNGATSIPATNQQQASAPSRPLPSSSNSSANYSNFSTPDPSNPWAALQPATSQPHSRAQPSTSNPWASIPAANNWSTQNNGLSNSMGGMKLTPSAPKSGPGAFGQTQQPKPSNGMDKWESLL